ncbi:hypothetical protein CR513_53749, partial [Mucuna pruriens]
MDHYEVAFQELGKPIYVYIYAFDTTMNSVIIQEGEGEQRPVYYISKALQGVEQRYQKIENATLAIITTAIRLRSYFQSHPVSSCHNPLINYLHTDKVLDDLQKARRIKREAAKYILVASQLYKRGFSFPLLWCLGELKTKRAIKEIHEGVHGSHIGGRALDSKIVLTQFYWPTLKKDSLAFIKKCDKCQRYADQHQAPLKQLHSITSP